MNVQTATTAFTARSTRYKLPSRASQPHHAVSFPIGSGSVILVTKVGTQKIASEMKNLFLFQRVTKSCQDENRSRHSSCNRTTRTLFTLTDEVKVGRSPVATVIATFIDVMLSSKKSMKSTCLLWLSGK